MLFIETRGNDTKRASEVRFSQALLSPSGSFGGLYVPKSFPTFSKDEQKELSALSYKELAKTVLTKLDFDLEDRVLDEALARYDLFDDGNDPVPLVKFDENAYVCELWHGPTRAFKDMALQPFGVILSHLAQKKGENYLILAATSGDTGPAALSTFEHKDNIKVACMYPDGGTSDVQRLQMVTMSKDNLDVIGIKGNFDDAQSALKNLLSSDDFKDFLEQKSIKLSAANSVNFGRIAFQIIYHIYSVLKIRNLENLDQEIDLIVPSGNFGNALGGYYAKKMGFPVGKIIIASNDNNILTELIQTGKYDISNKDLILTTSPAMDILKSSNVERVLFDLYGAKRTKELMDDLENKKCYELTQDELKSLQSFFVATYSNEKEVADAINSSAAAGYIMDPHTATCIKAKKLAKNRSIIFSTAEWTKFAPSMSLAIFNEKANDDKSALEKISSKYSLSIDKSIKDLFIKDINHKIIVDKKDIVATIESLI